MALKMLCTGQSGDDLMSASPARQIVNTSHAVPIHKCNHGSTAMRIAKRKDILTIKTTYAIRSLA